MQREDRQKWCERGKKHVAFFLIFFAGCLGANRQLSWALSQNPDQSEASAVIFPSKTSPQSADNADSSPLANSAQSIVVADSSQSVNPTQDAVVADSLQSVNSSKNVGGADSEKLKISAPLPSSDTSSNTLSDVVSDEIFVKSRMETLGIFKNGIVAVQETLTLPGNGRFVLADVPSAIHGSFFMESNANVTVLSTERVVETELSSLETLDFSSDFIGKTLQVLLPDETNPEWVQLISVCQKTANFPPEYSSSLAAPQETQWILKRENGELVIVPASSFKKLIFNHDSLATIKRKQPVLVFHVQQIAATSSADLAETSGKSVTNASSLDASQMPAAPNASPVWIRLSYLTKGMAWAPAYRVDLQTSDELVLEQSATLMNEQRSFLNVPVSLISGYPQIMFSKVDAPLSPDFSLAKFFQSLNNQNAANRDLFFNGNAAVAQQMVVMNNAAFPQNLENSLSYDATAESDREMAFSENMNLFFQKIGTLSLQKNDRMMLTIARKTIPYQKKVVWNIRDCRDSYGRFRDSKTNENWTPDSYGKTSSGEMDSDQRFFEPWDVLCFENPFSFPMTTGPATISYDGEFLAQNLSFWTNPQEEVLLPVSKALSLRVDSKENEQSLFVKKMSEEMSLPRHLGVVDSNLWGNFVRTPGFLWRVAVVEASITIQNQRNEETEMTVRRQITGEPIPDALFQSAMAARKQADAGQGAGKSDPEMDKPREEVDMNPALNVGQNVGQLFPPLPTPTSNSPEFASLNQQTMSSANLVNTMPEFNTDSISNGPLNDLPPKTTLNDSPAFSQEISNVASGSATSGSATLGSATLDSATLDSATLDSATLDSATLDSATVSAEATPRDTVLTESAFINRRHELTWNLKLKPYEKRTLHFVYQVYVAQ